jgi:FkbM family methyltransferase
MYVRPRTRPGTWDKQIMQLVMHGEYGELDFEGSVVVDVGAHIGSFSLLAAKKKAAVVHAYEANHANFELLHHNCSGEKQVVCHREAVWRSDEEREFLTWSPSEDRVNTGGGSVIDGAGNGGSETVPAVSFDDVVDRVGGKVDILKLDCEGSEYPILFTSKKLSAINTIVGEWHPVASESSWTADALESFLRSAGFDTEFNPTSNGLGHFRAVR